MAIDKKALCKALIDSYGTTFAEEIGIHVEQNTPAPLFQLLCTSLLFSAPISSHNASEAMRALLDAGLTTPQKMAKASWQERVDVITWHGYKRYDERTSTMLGEVADYTLEQYGGDLRRLRAEAGRDVGREHALLQEFKGIGQVGADIFLREVQIAWDEAYPYADAKVMKAARRLKLASKVEDLAGLARGHKRFARLAAALVHVDIEDEYDGVREQAQPAG